MARILVVDDEPSIVKLVHATLTARGHQVVEAFGGSEALTKAKLDKPDLILLDVMMPGMDGREVRKRLLEDPATKDIPVIHLSAVGDFEQQKQAFADGVTDYITKPFAPKELAERVAEVLDPTKRAATKTTTDQKARQLRTIVDIMRRDPK